MGPIRDSKICVVYQAKVQVSILHNVMVLNKIPIGLTEYKQV